MIVGEGKYRYEFVDGWEQLPSGWSHGDVAGVATDSQDNVYVFNRSEHPVIIYDQRRQVPRLLGRQTIYPRRTASPSWTTSSTLPMTRTTPSARCTLDGKILMTLGHVGPAVRHRLPRRTCPAT